MSSTTRERIVDETMRFFSENGYSGTSIAKIEAAAGLTPGAGGIYHHFKSKEALLAAGIERQLARLDALRDIRRVLGPLGDLKAELTLTARYILAELDASPSCCASSPPKPATVHNCSPPPPSSSSALHSRASPHGSESAPRRRSPTSRQRQSPPSASDRCSPRVYWSMSSVSRPRSMTKHSSTPGCR